MAKSLRVSSKRYWEELERRTSPPSPTEKALAKALVDMVECYGEMDDPENGPIHIIAQAVKAIRRVRPKYKFEDY